MDAFLNISKALSDATRLRCLMCLREGELCLCQVIDVIGLAPATLSKHMTILYQAGLVRRRKQGRWHFYALALDSDSPPVRRALDWAIDALAEEPTILADERALRGVLGKEPQQRAACYRREIPHTPMSPAQAADA